jgi:hypothetical protein
MSRWLETPAHVTEREGDLPGGFRAAGVACGLEALRQVAGVLGHVRRQLKPT